ncbi:hypothetical protein, partial [Litchfieldella qijiaojingensis]|uniref:hypothetical protein n=1 Tax=Litchfieldella qijiaojingensis TaxID=980347 RepID=UPI001E642AB9
ATYDEVATQITLLTHSAPDAAVDAGGSITEDLYEALIRRGYSLEDATAILADEAFQDQVLASMKTIAEVSGPLMDSETPPEADASAPEDAAPSDVYYDDQGLPVVELKTIVVIGERSPEKTPAQVVLRGASDINAYLEAHPAQRQIVEIGLAVAQGPKGVIELLVSKAIEHSSFGKKIAEATYEGGKLLAEWVEDRYLSVDRFEDDRHLIGGGVFAAGIVAGGITPGGKRGGGEHAGGHAPDIGAPHLRNPDSPYYVRIDPAHPGQPDPAYSVDTSTFASGATTANGGIRNSRAFWNAWAEKPNAALSQSNKDLIASGRSPKVDNDWIRAFPEHAPYKDQTLVHHHMDYGKHAIPLPSQVHANSPGFGVWHPPN